MRSMWPAMMPSRRADGAAVPIAVGVGGASSPPEEYFVPGGSDEVAAAEEESSDISETFGGVQLAILCAGSDRSRIQASFLFFLIRRVREAQNVGLHSPPVARPLFSSAISEDTAVQQKTHTHTSVRFFSRLYYREPLFPCQHLRLYSLKLHFVREGVLRRCRRCTAAPHALAPRRGLPLLLRAHLLLLPPPATAVPDNKQVFQFEEK